MSFTIATASTSARTPWERGPRIEGAFTALVTPFTAGGELDEPAVGEAGAGHGCNVDGRRPKVNRAGVPAHGRHR